MTAEVTVLPVSAAEKESLKMLSHKCPSCKGSGQVSRGRLVAIYVLPALLILLPALAIVGTVEVLSPKVTLAKQTIYASGFEAGLARTLLWIDEVNSEIRQAKEKNVRWYNFGSDKTHYETCEQALTVFRGMLAEKLQRMQAAGGANPGP